MLGLLDIYGLLGPFVFTATDDHVGMETNHETSDYPGCWEVTLRIPYAVLSSRHRKRQAETRQQLDFTAISWRAAVPEGTRIFACCCFWSWSGAAIVDSPLGYMYDGARNISQVRGLGHRNLREQRSVSSQNEL